MGYPPKFGRNTNLKLGIKQQGENYESWMRHAYQRQAAVLRGRTLLGGTQTEVHDREGRLPSGERPGGQIETCACHQWATDWRMVQGAVRQAVFIHSENGCTAQKGQRLGG